MSQKKPHDTPTIRWFKKRARQRMSKIIVDGAGGPAGHRRFCPIGDSLMQNQHLIAKEAGFASWAALRAATEDERQAAIERLGTAP